MESHPKANAMDGFLAAFFKKMKLGLRLELGLLGVMAEKYCYGHILRKETMTATFRQEK